MTEEEKKTTNKKKVADNNSASESPGLSLKYSAKISTISADAPSADKPQITPPLQNPNDALNNALNKMSPDEMKSVIQQMMVQQQRMQQAAVSRPGAQPSGAPQKLTKMQILMKGFDKLVSFIDKSGKYIADKYDDNDDKEVLKYTRSPAIFGIWVSVITIFVFFIWGGFAPINQAALAQGTIVLESQKRVIQHLEGGIIEHISVAEGRVVKKGQVLIQLSRTAVQASRDDAFNKYLSALAENNRLVSQRDGFSKINFDPELLKQAGNIEVSRILSSQQELFSSQIESKESNIKASESKIAQFIQQDKSWQVNLDSINKQLENKQKDYDAIKKLNGNKQIVSHADLRKIESELSQIEGRKAEIIGQLSQVAENKTTEEIKIKETKNQFLHNTVEGLKQNLKELVQAREAYNTYQDRLDRMDIKAPVAGVVGSLYKGITDGGVLPAQHPIMEIVPLDDHLVVDARVNMQDIDVVRKGQVAYSMVTAFKSRVVPKIKGKVISVSPDMVAPKMQGEMPYYMARIELDQVDLHSIMNKKHVELYPGMQVQVFIEIGSRSLLRYLLDPFLTSMDLAFREQ
jgi:HlyD family secretion protein